MAICKCANSTRAKSEHNDYLKLPQIGLRSELTKKGKKQFKNKLLLFREKKYGPRTGYRENNSYIADDVTAVINWTCKSREIHVKESSFNMRRGGEDIDGGLQKFFDNRRGPAHTVYDICMGNAFFSSL